jgi:hypothetical protein
MSNKQLNYHYWDAEWLQWRQVSRESMLAAMQMQLDKIVDAEIRLHSNEYKPFAVEDTPRGKFRVATSEYLQAEASRSSAP